MHILTILSHISSAWTKLKYSALDSVLIWILVRSIRFWFSLNVTDSRTSSLLSSDAFLYDYQLDKLAEIRPLFF